MPSNEKPSQNDVSPEGKGKVPSTLAAVPSAAKRQDWLDDLFANHTDKEIAAELERGEECE